MFSSDCAAVVKPGVCCSPMFLPELLLTLLLSRQQQCQQYLRQLLQLLHQNTGTIGCRRAITSPSYSVRQSEYPVLPDRQTDRTSLQLRRPVLLSQANRPRRIDVSSPQQGNYSTQNLRRHRSKYRTVSQAVRLHAQR